MPQAKIIGAGHYVPPKIVTNQDLVQLMDTSDAWIQERSGIKERHFIVPGEDNTAGMGIKAARIAIERAGIDAEDIELIVFATTTPDYFTPGPGVIVQKELCTKPIPALDIRNQCSGFIYALSVADQFIKTGMYKTVLVIGSETQSTTLDLSTRGRNIAVLFGDGAGAVVMQASADKNKGVLSTHLYSEGEYAEELFVRSPGTFSETRIYKGIEEDVENIYAYMNGSMVFKHAILRMSEAIESSLLANGYKTEMLDWVVPHQANLRISQMVGRTLKIDEAKVFSNIEKYGNTTAATIPICLSEMWEQGLIKENQLMVLVAFGSGFTWASALIRW